MSLDPIVIIAAARTPLGAFQGSLKDAIAPQLGATVMAAVLKRAKLDPALVSEVYYGLCAHRRPGSGAGATGRVGRTSAYRSGRHFLSARLQLGHIERTLIEQIASYAREAGRDIASPDESRAMLHLSRGTHHDL
ncbi:hypothetical protein [Georgfuchsia toluolica]|nr:hypothetical protein [Georgfuchsia toluolica]